MEDNNLFTKKINNMTNEEKIAMLEDMLELDGGSLTPEMELSSIEEYDSMAKLSLIVLMDDEFSKKLTGEQIREFKTVQDILDFMG
jgi:acyl carrier protein